MNIIIVGCGRVGSVLAKELNEEGNNVTVIDVDSEKVNAVSVGCDVMGIVGNGATHEIQKEAGIDNADLLIAATGFDEINLLCCLIAKKAGNCQTIARIRNPEYSADAPFLKEELGLAMVINPEYTTAKEIGRVLRFPSAINIETFAGGKVELLKFKIPDNSPIIGYQVRDLMQKFHCDVLVCTIERGGDGFVANADSSFNEGDIVSVIASPKNAHDFFKKIGHSSRPVKNCIIAGGGRITHYLCEDIEHAGIPVKVIDNDRSVCETFADSWQNVQVIYGNPADRGLLEEEGIESAGAFVSLTAKDEDNIILSLFASSKTDGKIITKVNNTEYNDLVRKLGLDAVVHPKNVTADAIIRYVRAMSNTQHGNVEYLYNIIPDKVEASEFTVKEESALTGKELMNVKFKKNVLVAAILRGKKVIIPRGHDAIEVGDKIVVVSEMMPLLNITDILG